MYFQNSHWNVTTAVANSSSYLVGQLSHLDRGFGSRSCNSLDVAFAARALHLAGNSGGAEAAFEILAKCRTEEAEFIFWRDDAGEGDGTGRDGICVFYETEKPDKTRFSDGNQAYKTETPYFLRKVKNLNRNFRLYPVHRSIQSTFTSQFTIHLIPSHRVRLGPRHRARPPHVHRPRRDDGGQGRALAEPEAPRRQQAGRPPHLLRGARGPDRLGGEVPGEGRPPGKCSTVPSPISIRVSVLQFAATVEHSEKCTIASQLAFQSSILGHSNWVSNGE